MISEVGGWFPEKMSEWVSPKDISTQHDVSILQFCFGCLKQNKLKPFLLGATIGPLLI